MKRVIILALSMVFVINFCQGFAADEEKDAALKKIRVIGCIPFSGDKKLVDFATTSFWKELKKCKYIDIVDIDKMYDVVKKLNLECSNITNEDISKIAKELSCDAIFVCSIKTVIVPLVIKEVNAKVELFEPLNKNNLFSTVQSSGQLISLSLESIASDAAKNAAKEFTRLIKKLH